MKGSLLLRPAVRVCLPWVAALLAVVPACSSDDTKPPLGSPSDGGESGSGGSGKGGSKNTAGTSATEGGTADQGGQPSEAGSAAGGDAMTGGGAGGTNGEGGVAGEPEPPAPPDLITKTGGPWPDSLTGACVNGKRVSVCPQIGDDTFGQDGTYRINVPSYSATDSALTDSVTGLIWQIAPSSAAVTQTEAVAYCAALELGGQSDWRLPTLLEYVSLFDEGQGSGYALPAQIPIDQTGVYWTASASVGENSFFIVADDRGAWNVGVAETPFVARCVRGATLGGSWQVGTGVVSDSKLSWQTSGVEDTPRTWQESLSYCEALSLGGKDDWRLPSIKELATIIDPAATTSPALRAELGSNPAAYYWSSTPAFPFVQSVVAFALDSSIGISTTFQVDEARAARCVRTTD
jgi:hypothetical protein